MVEGVAENPAAPSLGWNGLAARTPADRRPGGPTSERGRFPSEGVTMSSVHCGVWIDHAEAVVVRFDDQGESTVRRFTSDAGSRSKSAGGMSGSGGRVGGASHKKTERKRRHQLERFFDEVAEEVAGAEKVAVIGPGTAKKAFESRLRETSPGVNLLAVLPAHPLTEPQPDREVPRGLRDPRLLSYL